MSLSTNNQATGTRIRVRGLVQGVGFRPAVWRMAHEFKLSGQVSNVGDEVMIDIWGETDHKKNFALALVEQCPPLARIDSVLTTPLEGTPVENFEIIKSLQNKSRTYVTPDAATCPDCLSEIADPTNRRYEYPFTNCTNCGPRLSIIDSIPYDRANTSMGEFIQCDACEEEYNNPNNRRFHAQPNACPKCGPKVWLYPAADKIHADNDLQRARELLAQGRILAIKGLGGFHLACDATNETAVALLRKRKNRPAKPFALMASDLDVIQQYCHLNQQEQDLLTSAEAPIVLLDTHAKMKLAESVAPKQNVLGFMLPYTPLHHLLFNNLDRPLVMTSGNASDAPQCTDNEYARSDLDEIADYWLLNDRDVRHRIDDSVVRVIENKVHILRRARGYAPTPISLPEGFENAPEVIAFGSELKNTFCLIKDQKAILSQHMGDLENASAFADYEKNLTLYQQLFNHHPTLSAIDLHPEYLSSKLGRSYAEEHQIELHSIQHHHAHLAACLADNDWPLSGKKVLGVILDGTGFGQNGTLWGGEFLHADYFEYERLASFKPVGLIGAAKAIHEPWRNTYAHLAKAIGWQSLFQNYADLELVGFLKHQPYATFNAMLDKEMNTPSSSSCGRLFDAVAAAIGICREQISYEGQAAIELEALVDRDMLTTQSEYAYSFTINQISDIELPYVSPTGMWKSLLSDLQNNQSSQIIACRFHLGLANIIVEMIERLSHKKNKKTIDTIVLSGGVFQNKIIFELVSHQLRQFDYKVLSHTQVPANDGGLALGQAVVAIAHKLKENSLCA